MPRLINVEISGVSPLLQHKFPEHEEVSKKGIGGKVAAQDYSEEEHDHLYLNKEKQVYQPSSHIEGCMIKAASEFFIKGHKGKRYTDRVKAFVDVIPTEIVHKNQDWHVDTRSVVIQRSRVNRRRPSFATWGLEFEINIRDPSAIQPETLHEILDSAGHYVGI